MGKEGGWLCLGATQVRHAVGALGYPGLPWAQQAPPSLPAHNINLLHASRLLAIFILILTSLHRCILTFFQPVLGAKNGDKAWFY